MYSKSSSSLLPPSTKSIGPPQNCQMVCSNSQRELSQNGCAPCSKPTHNRVALGRLTCHTRSVGLPNCALDNFGSLQFMSAGPSCVGAPSICTQIHHHPAEAGFARERPPFILDVTCSANTCCPMPECEDAEKNVNLGFPFSVVPQPLHCVKKKMPSSRIKY